MVDLFDFGGGSHSVQTDPAATSTALACLQAAATAAACSGSTAAASGMRRLRVEGLETHRTGRHTRCGGTVEHDSVVSSLRWFHLKVALASDVQLPKLTKNLLNLYMSICDLRYSSPGSQAVPQIITSSIITIISAQDPYVLPQ